MTGVINVTEMAIISTAKKKEIVAQQYPKKEERRNENKLKKSTFKALEKNDFKHILLLVSMLINSRCNKVEIT